jgi:chromosome segregation protein
VVDAIRWVLGEQSPKHLRGESMEDVIFNGNERMAPTGMAQVSLTLENVPKEHPPSALDLDVSTIPAQFRDLSEIMVTRRYFRSGESEYFINKTPCRLKDITEIFLGTGVGTKAYAIIEQGRVEQLINAKPEDRRLFIEEAAGTTLYRSRKLAAERKMERTRENLLRVNDVLREIERQIQYLHRMAKKAEQYRALQEEIRRLDLDLCAAQWRRLTAAVAELEAELACAREQERKALGELSRLEHERPRKLAAQVRAEEELARQRETAAVLESECRSVRQRIDLLGQEVSERERRVARLRAQASALADQHTQARHALQQQEREWSECGHMLVFDEGELARIEAELMVARATVAAANVELDTLKTGLVGVATREAECRNDLAAQTRRRDDARRRLQKLAEEEADARQQLAAVDGDVTSRRVDIAALREQLRSAQGQREQGAERVRALAEERRGWEREVSAAHDLVLQLRSRSDSLRELQRNYEGYERGVRSILLDAQPDSGVLGVVADVIGVPQQYERAVAAALGSRLQYVIVRKEDDGVGAVTTLRDRDSGRGSFIPLSPRPVHMNGNGAASHNGKTQRLLDVVRVEEPYRQVAETLLSEVVLVPDLNAGLALWRQNGVHVTMVTPQGDVIDATGVITGGSERPIEEEIVSRRRLLEELTASGAAAASRLARAQAEARRLGSEMNQEETTLKRIDQNTHALTLQMVTAEKDLERLEAERPRWLDRLEVVRFESTTVISEEQESDVELGRIGEALSASTAERESLEGLLRARREHAAAAAVRAAELGDNVTSMKVCVAERRQRHEAAASATGRFTAQIEELSSRLAAGAAELEETEAERAGLQVALYQAEAQRAAREAQRQDIEAQTAHARATLDSVTQAVVAHDGAAGALREQLDGWRARCSQYEVALAEKRLSVGHLAQSVREKYGTEIMDCEPGEHTEEEEIALERLSGLREKLLRMGEVSVGAIDELRELEDRARFLGAQKEDLERSLGDLERTIQRLNRASRTRFAETFAAVNEQFQSVLPRLFRGGEARLVLTDEHNLLESGVEIVVRPPGKRLDTVTLLSGGEKALVAVSLIFSLFLTNPTPFCFLDEIDAPLDDANIGRFTSLLRDMSEHSQFVVITHNKRTMQAANMLYGVTMEEPGVSKVISVAMH